MSPSRSARERVAKQRALQARRRKQNILLAIACAVVACVIIGVAVGYGVAKNHRTQQASGDDSFVQKVIDVPPSVINQVGAGTSDQSPTKAPNGAALTTDGKPRLLYFGGEFCPYCAMERWSLVNALSRFGTITGVQGLTSSEGSIPTMTFVNAKYTSDYLTFTSYEVVDQNHQPLQTPSAADAALQQKYNPDGTIPFLLYNGEYMTTGATYDGSAFAGQTDDQIADQLKDPNSAVTQGVIGAANVITAQICTTMTDNKPADVCTASGVTEAAKKLTS